jgi:hypothetical protein
MLKEDTACRSSIALLQLIEVLAVYPQNCRVLVFVSLRILLVKAWKKKHGLEHYFTAHRLLTLLQ